MPPHTHTWPWLSSSTTAVHASSHALPAATAALKRKGKGSDVSEEDMDAVVFTHNTMNEITWQQVGVPRSAAHRRCRLA